MADSNIIDELKVVISLDPQQYEAGEKKIRASFNTTKTEARKTAEELEASGKQGSQFFDLLTDKALRLGTVLLGGVGLKDLIANSISTGSAMGYAAQNINISAQQLGLWQNAIREVGGDAAQVTPALLGISQALTTIQLRGKGSADLISAFQFLGITDFVNHTTGKLKTVAELLPEIHRGLARLDAPTAFNVGTSLGLTPDFINLLRKGDEEFKKYMKAAASVGTITDEQVEDAQKATRAWGLFKSALASTANEMTGELIDAFNAVGKAMDFIGSKATDKDKKVAAFFKNADKYAASDAGALAGGIAGAAAGSVLGPVGTVVGAIGGVVVGGIVGASASKTNEALNPTQPQQTELTPDQIFAQQVFNQVQKLEGGKANTITPTGEAADPFAYGKNQITLGTAVQYDKNATIEKLLDPAYNDAIAKKIEAFLIRRYGKDSDAIAIAYHNGPGAADRFVAQGRSTAGIPGFGPQSQLYLARERALADASRTSNTNSSTANIGTVNVNAPNATDAAGVAAAMRKELATNSLLSQGNTGPT